MNKDPDFYEIHRCAKCYLVELIVGYSLSNGEREKVSAQILLTAEQGLRHLKSCDSLTAEYRTIINPFKEKLE